MSSTYSPGLAIQLIGTGDQAGQWGISTDVNLGTLIESAIAGYVVQTFADVDLILPMPLGADGGSGTPASPVTARNMFISCVGTNTTIRNLILPLNKKIYFINNSTTGGFAVIAKCSGGDTGVTIPNGSSALLVCTGTNIIQAVNFVPSWTVGGAAYTGGLTSSITNTSLVSGDTARQVISAGASSAAWFVSNAAQSVALITGGPTGAQVCVRTLGAYPFIWGTNNTFRMSLNNGLVLGAATGGDQGTGTLNATNLFINGVAVLTSVVNITGNAATATKLATPRTINSAPFDGTANITVGVAASGISGLISLTTQVSGLLPVANANANLYRGTLGSGVITAQNNGVPSGGNNGDIFLIY